MYIRIKADFLQQPDKRECVIPISKKTFVSDLKKLIEGEIDVEPALQRLFYKGKELNDEEQLIDYSVVPNDVITVFKRHVIKRDDNVEPQIDYKIKQDEPKDDAGEKYVDGVSKYYKIGDMVDVRWLDTSAWYEGCITEILKREDDNSDDEHKLLFKVKNDDHVSVIPFEGEAGFGNIRPRSFYTYKIAELEPGMKVLVNYNIDSPKSRGIWYDCILESVGSLDIIGTIFVGEENLTDCNIKFIQEIMRIEEPQLLENRTTDLLNKQKQRKYPFHCEKCKDNRQKSCKYCGCKICSGKSDCDKIILCDDCDFGFHTFCLKPPLETIPNDDWYCPSCKTDDSEIVKPGEKTKASKKREKMPSKQNETKRDWGKGMACAGLTKRNELVPKSHVGPVPKVEVGYCWKFRHGVAESGVHRPPVAGIHGQESDCAYSIVLSGGYEDDVDYGYEFYYTGSGGRDLSGNKRISNQSFDQELTRTNKALAMNCNAPFNNKVGAESKDWKKGKPVRVVRSYKLRKHSKYAPEDGYRYDGLYKVVKYYPEKGKAGFLVWRYLLKRDDPAPAPWEKNAKKFEIIYPPGYLDFEEAKRKKDNLNKENCGSPQKSTKRKHTKESKEEQSTSKKQKCESYILDQETKTAIKNDNVNEKLWAECETALKDGKKQFLDKVEEIFKCIICIELVFDPVTLKCGHNLCKGCLKETFKHCESNVYSCPHCRVSLDKKETMEKKLVNTNLGTALNLLFPGYQTH